MFLLHVFFVLQLLDPMLEARDPVGLEHQGLGQVLGQYAVKHVLNLVKLEGHHYIQLVQLLLLLQLQ